eukprot:scaffold11205_cov101-Isochrysis_galbana.AAC.2
MRLFTVPRSVRRCDGAWAAGGWAEIESAPPAYPVPVFGPVEAPGEKQSERGYKPDVSNDETPRRAIHGDPPAGGRRGTIWIGVSAWPRRSERHADGSIAPSACAAGAGVAAGAEAARTAGTAYTAMV